MLLFDGYFVTWVVEECLGWGGIFNTFLNFSLNNFQNFILNILSRFYCYHVSEKNENVKIINIIIFYFLYFKIIEILHNTNCSYLLKVDINFNLAIFLFFGSSVPKDC